MKPRPPKETKTIRNRRDFQIARRQGWKLFSGVDLKPWERQLLVKSLKIVLGTDIGSVRKIDETGITVKQIIPFTAKALKVATKGKIPEDQWKVFCQLMDWYAKNPVEFPHYGRPPKDIRDLGKKLDKRTFVDVGLISCNRTFFRLRKGERPEHRSEQFDFKKDIEFQLKHDIYSSILFIKFFLNALEFG